MSKFATPENLLGFQVEEFNKGNISFLMKLYENGACFAHHPGQVLNNRRLIRKAFHKVINSGVKLNTRVKRAYYADNLALLITEWSLNGSEPDSTHISLTGNGIIVFRRQSNGIWLMVIENPWGTS